MGRALLHSYSRGAWLAAICGLAYLANEVFSFQFSQASPRRAVFSRRVLKNVLLLEIIGLSIFVLAFWQFRHTEWHPARRAFSAGNMNDFSWRNRIASWEGALQIAAEHPWLGAGWNQPASLYQNYYLPPKVGESDAIWLNDYLVLGAMLGVPALICFGMYLWLSLTRKPDDRGQISDGGIPPIDLKPPPSDLWQAICRAGAIVLLVGFWFDGGLFNLPTASIFWILLELGALRFTPPKAATIAVNTTPVTS
jgi:O-antigen ligase